MSVEPADYPANHIIWTCNNSDITFAGGNTGTNVLVACHQTANGADMGELAVRFGDCPSISPSCKMAKSAIREMPIYVYQCMRSPLPICPISQQILDGLNDIYSQIGIRFYIVNRGAVMEKNAFSVSSSNSPGPWLKDEYCRDDDGISLFVVDNVLGANAFTDRLFGIVFVEYGFAAQTLAHEIGHYLGADDVYVSSSEIDDQLPDASVNGTFERKHMADADWNNGTGQCFYRRGELHSDAIKRLLMYGIYDESSLDIPHLRIEGVGFTDDGERLEVRQVKVGREAMSEGGGVL